MSTAMVFPAHGTSRQLLLCRLEIEDAERIFPLVEAETPGLLELWVSNSCPTECAFTEAAQAHLSGIVREAKAFAGVVSVRLRTD